MNPPDKSFSAERKQTFYVGSIDGLAHSVVGFKPAKSLTSSAGSTGLTRW